VRVVHLGRSACYAITGPLSHGRHLGFRAVPAILRPHSSDLAQNWIQSGRDGVFGGWVTIQIDRTRERERRRERERAREKERERAREREKVRENELERERERARAERETHTPSLSHTHT